MRLGARHEQQPSITLEGLLWILLEVGAWIVHRCFAGGDLVSAYTRGPWVINGYAGQHDEAGACIFSRSGIRIASTESIRSHTPEGWKEYMANARLIATAPELFEALKLLHSGPDSDHEEPEDRMIMSISRKAWKAMESAIAKTEGP